MTVESLQSRTRFDLARLAKRHSVEGWHGMRKEELIEALRKVLKARQSRKQRKNNGHPPSAKRPMHRAPTSIHVNGSEHNATTNGKQAEKLEPTHVPRRLRCSSRILKACDAHGDSGHDSVVAQSHDAFWIFVLWSISRRTMQRAEAALDFEWHRSIPVIRVYDVTSDDSSEAATWVSDVEIHGDVDHWFIPVENPPRSYRLQIGYISPSGKFFMLARSNRVTTPKPSALRRNGGASAHSNGHESNGKAPQQSPVDKKSKSPSHNGHNGHTPWLANGCRAAASDESYLFEVHTELVVRGVTHPHATMTLSGETIALNADGSFLLHMPLPDGRQAIPAVTIAPNGAQQRTIVLGIERNTRELEPLDLTEQR